MPATPDELLDALGASVAHLFRTTEPLGPDQLQESAYPTEWTIADVLSHLGSGAVIMQTRLDAVASGAETPDNFAQPIWDAWNAKTPEAKAADGLAADRALLDGLTALTAEARAGLSLPFGPMTLDFAGLLGMRLNEHALHTWDVDVVLDPGAEVQPETVPFVIDNLEMIVRFAGKPTGVERELHVRTTNPDRDFTLAVSADAVALTPCATAHTPDLELPAEAFVRLVYGRLDAQHSPPVGGTADLDELRRVFPGI